MADSSDSESSPSTPERSTHDTATGDPHPQPQLRGDSKGDAEKDSSSSSSPSRDSSPSIKSPSPKPQPTKKKEKEPSLPANRLNSLEIQQKERVEAVRQADAKGRQAAKDLVVEANRQQDAKDRLEEAKRLEEEEAQARRREFVEPAAPTTGYACGDCNATVFLGLGDPVRCRVCGCRILYKKRTNRLMQFKTE